MAQLSRKPSHPNQGAPSQSDGELRIADLSVGPGLTDRYDDVLQQLCDTSTASTLEDSATRFCHHVRHALNADTAYLCNRTSLSIVTTSSKSGARETCEDTRELHSALTTMISDLWNCNAPLCPPDIKVFAEQASFSYCIIPLDTKHDHLLVIANADIDKALIGDYMANALTALYDVFLQHRGIAPPSSVSELEVLDSLQSEYQMSSKKITNRRFDIFERQLKKQSVEFDGLRLASNTSKADALLTTLPESFYKTADLWNKKFKSALDQHTLIESAYGYKALCDSENLLKFSDSRSLKVRVHAETLNDENYMDALQDLIEKSVIHASRLLFSVIPQVGYSHAEALIRLHDRFGIPQESKLKSAADTHRFADEFDLLLTNGIKKKSAIKHS